MPGIQFRKSGNGGGLFIKNNLPEALTVTIKSNNSSIITDYIDINKNKENNEFLVNNSTGCNK